MIDDQEIKNLVLQHVQSVVENYVAAVMEEESWQQDLEQKLQKHLQDRLTAKFSNLSVMPEIQESVEKGIANLFQQGQLPGIEKYLDTAQLNETISKTASRAVKAVAETVVIDPEWIHRVENDLHDAMTQKLLNRISDIDLDAYIVRSIDLGIERWQQRFLNDFRTRGISDRASQCELTVVDGAVMLSTALVTPTLLVENSAEVDGSLRIKDLVVTGTVNVDCESWNGLAEHSANMVQTRLGEEWKQQMVDAVLESSKTSGINFDSISIEGRPLIEGNQLNSSITDTSITTVGTLRELRVHGRATLANTVFANNNRLGVNTNSPESALSVWDEEVSVSVGKHSINTAFVGTARQQSLVLGVNRKGDIVIDEQGLTTVKQLRIDRWRVSHHDTVPGWSGTKGDLVINNSPGENRPFGWSCLGGFRWLEIWGNKK